MHVIGPELGLTQPGMTIACGDSHTSTHGAFGAVAFGIGTSQVRDVLASQCLAMDRSRCGGSTSPAGCRPGVYAKDVILEIIRRLGVQGGVGYAYEYGGDVIDRMSMDERMTICNMSIEGGARVGYVNPDETTFAYLRGRQFAPQGDAFERGRRVVASTRVRSRRALRRRGRRSTRRRSTRPSRGASTRASRSASTSALPRRPTYPRGAWRVMALIHAAGPAADRGHEDRRRVHRLVHQRAALRSARGGADRPRPARVAPHVRALVVPGSQAVRVAGGAGRARPRCSATRASNGAAPAARCAWR